MRFSMIRNRSLTERLTVGRVGSRVFKRSGLLTLVVLLAGFVAALFIFANASDNRLVKTITLDSPIHLAAFSTDGRLVACVNTSDKATGRYRIDVWRTDDGSKVASTP